MRAAGNIFTTAVLAVATAVLAVATAITLVAIGVSVFLTPAWVFAEQDRAAADAWTGWPPVEVHRITGEVLHDLVFGPPSFAQVDPTGVPVFDSREQGHLRDVRGVFGAAAGIALASLLVLVGTAAVAARRRHLAARVWRAVELGVRALAVTVVALGVVSLVAFDAAFQVFHELFFATGTYLFDPTRDRLVQLFPDAFWSDTTIALGVVLLVVATATAALAGRRLARARRLANDPGPNAARGPKVATGPDAGRDPKVGPEPAAPSLRTGR